MYHYHLSFYGQTDGQVRECLRKLKHTQPLIRAWNILADVETTGKVRASHTVELLFDDECTCDRATRTDDRIVRTYLEYAVGHRLPAAERFNEPIKIPMCA